MRIAACYFVIYNHTGVNGFFLFSKREPTSLLFWLELFFSVFCKFSVPLFFAISGALLLTKEESLEDIYKKRILRILIVLLLSSILYYGWSCIVDGVVLSWKFFCLNLYESTLSAHLWYLYAYLGFLMCLPMLRSMVNHMETKYFYYMFALIFFYQGVLPTIEYLVSGFEYTLNGYLRLGWITTNIVCFPCLGYFLEYRVNPTKRTFLWLWITNLMTIGLTCALTFREIMLTGECNESVSQKFFSYFVLINCATIFLTIKYLCQNMTFPRAVEKQIVSMGECCFGIYIIHLIIKYLDAKIGLYNAMIMLGIEDILVAFLFTFFVFLASYALTKQVRRIPGMRRLI